MANEYFVNSADLTSVADAIRTKGETTEQLVFPGGFVDAIVGMETGKTGATLTVTTPAEGITVTVTKGEMSYTKTTGADGTAVFSGLETGTWTIAISDGSQTATGTVNIDADYAANMTFFAATINVTYPAGLVCTATDGVTTLRAPNTSGTWACVVPNVGTWKVALSSGFYENIDITQDGEEKTIDKWYLYKSGDEYEYTTGGWASQKYSTSESGTGTMSKDDTCITLTAPSGTSIAAYTVNRIDLTGYSTLYFSIIYTNLVKSWRLQARVIDGLSPSDYDSNIGYVDIGSGAGTYSIDVSKITGKYYISVDERCVDTFSYIMKFDKVWLE